MKPITTFFRTGLCLLLSLQLLFPAAPWAAEGSRDLIVEEMKDTVALWVLSIGVSIPTAKVRERICRCSSSMSE